MLSKAGRKFSTHIGIASFVGVGLGLFCASRLRSTRLAYLQAFKVIRISDQSSSEITQF